MDVINFEKEFYAALNRKDFEQCGEMLSQNQVEVDSLLTQIDTMIAEIKKNQVTLNAFAAILRLHVDKEKTAEERFTAPAV